MQIFPQITVKHSNILFLFLAFFTLAGCSGSHEAPLDEELGKSSWSAMEALDTKARQASGPYNSSIGFRLSMPEESYILGAYIWSNNTLASQHPVRLDLQSTVGGTVAKMKEEPDYFLLFDVKNNAAIISKNAEDALFSMGVPMPFTLADLSLLLNGRYKDFLLSDSAEQPVLNSTTPERESIFKIETGPRSGYLVLNPRGYPIKWESQDQNGWSMELSYQDVTTLVANVTPLPGPTRITVHHPDGYNIAMQIKSLKKQPRPFNETQLELLIPTGANVRELNNHRE